MFASLNKKNTHHLFHRSPPSLLLLSQCRCCCCHHHSTFAESRVEERDWGWWLDASDHGCLYTLDVPSGVGKHCGHHSETCHAAVVPSWTVFCSQVTRPACVLPALGESDQGQGHALPWRAIGRAWIGYC